MESEEYRSFWAGWRQGGGIGHIHLWSNLISFCHYCTPHCIISIAPNHGLVLCVNQPIAILVHNSCLYIWAKCYKCSLKDINIYISPLFLLKLNTGKLEKEKAKRLIHNYNQIYNLCLSPLKIDNAFRPFQAGQDMPLEPLLHYLKEL